jgi:hypothetical protein
MLLDIIKRRKGEGFILRLFLFQNQNNFDLFFDQSIVAITFNSIAIGVGRAFTSTVVRAGRLSEKYSAYTLL